MTVGDAAAYLERLLNRKIDPAVELRLSSAQRARFMGWLSQHEVKVSDRDISRGFVLAKLLGQEPKSAVASGPAASVDAETPGRSVGIDIQKISELFPTLAHSTDFKAEPDLLAIFTQREISCAEARPVPQETLAGVFAAKEAIRKCLSSREMANRTLRDLEVLPDDNGAPASEGFDISISHSGDNAVAVAVRQASTPQQPAGSHVSAAELQQPARADAPRSSPIQLLSASLLLIIAVLQLITLFRMAH